MTSDFDWTADAIARLRAFWAAGITTAEIGRRMGVSKNAVVGKAHRLDLPPRPGPIRARGSGERPLARERTRIRRGGPSLPPQVAADSALPPLPPAAKPVAPPTFRPVRQEPCCWPIGEPRTRGFRFAQARGLAVKGYEPTADDRRNLAARRAARAQAAEAEPGATMQPPQENTLTNTSRPQPHQAQAVQPTQPTTPVSAPASAPTPAPVATASMAVQQIADSPAASQARKGSQRPDKADGATKAAEPGADAGQPAGRTGEAKRDALPAQAGGKPTQQQEYPRQARDPWMDEAGGYAALSPAQRGSAERSHERWIAAGTPEKPHTMDLEEYVGHVQDKRAEARAKEARPEAQAGNGKGSSKAEATPAPSALAAKAAGEKAAAENGTAEAAQLSPNGRKALAYIEKQIGTQMAKLTDDEKASLRAHAFQALAKREREVGPVQLPAEKADRKPQAGRDQAAVATKRKVRDGEAERKPVQVQQPRMSPS